MGVVNVPMASEGVEQRFDRRPMTCRNRTTILPSDCAVSACQRCLRRGDGVSEIGRHLRIGHRCPRPEREYVVEPKADKSRALHRGEIETGRLDAQNVYLATTEVGFGQLGRGVASTGIDQRRIAAQQIGAIDEQAELVEAGGVLGSPPVLRRLPQRRLGSVGSHRGSLPTHCSTVYLQGTSRSRLVGARLAVPPGQTQGGRRPTDVAHGAGQRTGKKMSVRHLDWSGSAPGSVM